MRFFLKMYRVSQNSMMGTVLSTYSGRLPKWGSMLSGDIFAPRMLALRIKESVGSAWPTPKALMIDETVEQWQTRRAIPGNKMMGASLAVAVKLWPTPQAFDANDIQRDRGKIDFSKGGHRNLREEIF